MKSRSRKRTPTIVNLTVKRRYLTEREVERLMDCARKYGRYGHRDATMILVAYRHGLRASEVCDLQWQQIELSEGRLDVHRVKNGIPSVHPIRVDEIRALRKLRREYPRGLRVRFRARRANQSHRLPPPHPARRRSRQDAISYPPPHASPRLWVQARQRWPRHAGLAALPRAQKHPAHGALRLRGTVLDAGSILEDLISFLVPAIGRVTVGHIQIDYSFAASSEASLHFGFALGTLLLLKDPKDGILVQLASKVPTGSQIYITGHSQGAAMATLLRSYLAYASDAPTNQNYSYKTYVYAQPKPGDDHYAADFENRFCNIGLAFRVTNSLDWIPQVPFTIEFPADINTPNPLSALVNPRLVAIFKIGRAS